MLRNQLELANQTTPQAHSIVTVDYTAELLLDWPKVHSGFSIYLTEKPEPCFG